VTTVVDLTAEFRACRAAVGRRSYRCLPTLDARTADAQAFAGLARELAAISGPVLIHCAQGHGRSGMLLAAVLIARGTVVDADEALAVISRIRPAVRLSGVQRVALERLAPNLVPVGR
jgi:protein-tyrosine phosphatase